MLLLNKTLLSYYGFRFPVTLTAIHMLACSLLSYLCIDLMRLVPPVKLHSREQLKRVGLLGAVFCLSVVLGNVSLRFIPVSFTQAIGATTPFFTAVLAYALQRRTESASTYLTLVPVVVGVVVASKAEPSFNLAGFVAAISATAARALKSVLQGALLSSESEKIDSQNLLRFMAPTAAFILLPCAIVAEGGAFMGFLSDGVSPGMLLLLLLNACTAYAVNLTNFLVTKHTGALTLQVLGNAKGAVAVVVSVAIFRNPVTLAGILGYAVTIAGVAMYSEQKRRSKAAKDLAKEATGPTLAARAANAASSQNGSAAVV